MKRILVFVLVLICFASSMSTAVIAETNNETKLYTTARALGIYTPVEFGDNPTTDYLIYQNDSIKLAINYTNGKLTRNKDGDIKIFDVNYSPFTKYKLQSESVMTRPFAKYLSPDSNLLLFYDDAGISYIYNIAKDTIETIPFRYAVVVWNKEGNDVLFASHMEYWREGLAYDILAPRGLWVKTKDGGFKQLIGEDKFADFGYYSDNEAHFYITNKQNFIFYFPDQKPLELVYSIDTEKTKYITYIPANCDVLTKKYDGKSSLNLLKYNNLIHGHKGYIFAEYGTGYARYSTSGKIPAVFPKPFGFYGNYMYYLTDGEGDRPIVKLNLDTFKKYGTGLSHAEPSYPPLIREGKLYYEYSVAIDNNIINKAYIKDLNTNKILETYQTRRDRYNLTIYGLKNGYKLCHSDNEKSWVEGPDATTVQVFRSDCILAGDYIYFTETWDSNDSIKKSNVVRMKYDGSEKQTILSKIAVDNLYYYKGKLYFSITEGYSKVNPVRALYSSGLDGKNYAKVYKGK